MRTTLSQRQFERQRGFRGRRPSGHRQTEGGIAQAIQRAEASGNKDLVARLWALLPSGELSRQPGWSQRQRRKAKRQAWAAGDKRAFG